MNTEYRSFAALLQGQDPNGVALEYFVGLKKAHVTYGELLGKMAAFSLPSANVVGIFASTDPTAVIALLSILGKRRVVLLNPDDPLPTIEAQIKATHIGALIGDEELQQEFGHILDPYFICADKGVFFFTSGTTSKAKAVVLSEESLCAAAYEGGSLLPLTPEDSLLAVLPFSHVFGFVCSLLWPLSFGAKVCLGRGLRSIFLDFDAFRPSVTTLVPQMAGFLVLRNLFNAELKLVLIGAGDCPDIVLKAIQGKGIRVSFGYGLTETSSGIALSLGQNPRAMTICPDYEVKLGEDGEILARCSKTMMQGYYENETITAPNIDEEGYLHTGDLGKMENGLLSIIGRKKEILVFDDGSKLFLPEYEADLAAKLGPDNDFAVLQDQNGSAVLFIHKPLAVEGIIDTFNLGVPRSHRIAKIIYSEAPLPRTKTNKVQRYLITLP